MHLYALSCVRGIGEISLKALLRSFPDPREVWQQSEESLEEVLRRARLKNPAAAVQQIYQGGERLLETAHRELSLYARRGIHLLTVLDPSFPQRLLDLEDRPHWLFVEGNVDLLSMSNLVAVVGTRQATPRGLKKAQILTWWLAHQGFGVVSGLAEGIDDAAHITALDCNAPTIAVLGTGIARDFPTSTVGTRHRIVAEGGAVVSEYLPNEPYSKSHFVRRNRIQAALSYATVPVEAGTSGGTAHTYRFARDLNRMTFGVTANGETENGLLETLRSDCRPIFRLAVKDDMERLLALLSPALDGVPPRRPSPLLFRSTIREFERVIDSYPVTEEDVRHVLVELEQRWNRRARDSQGRDS
jgi:DNA processing protein